MDSHSCYTPAKDMMNPLLRNRCEVAIASKSRSSQASLVSRCPGVIEYIVSRGQVAHLCLPNPSLVCGMREASSGHSVTGSIVDKFEDLIGETALGSIRRSRYGDQATESHDEDAFEFLTCNIGTVGVPTVSLSGAWYCGVESRLSQLSFRYCAHGWQVPGQCH